MSADNQTVTNPMTQLDYAERRLEERDTGTQSASALLSGLACGMGVLALWFAPMVLGFVGIACGILGVALAGERDRIGKIGLTIAEPPVDIPAHDACLAWHRRFDQDRGHQWLRDSIVAEAKALS